ncbi:hypothetical protein KQX54_013687 [Cotesia glomerata]|uniref:Uncharacterized protein n=1 Tax=Cotesia glomerata TaxID=32391 RepID=A0AAV7IM50_COTGL|nr:hypothetical protein KQX54_013687 [Cotesia glomerata]
MYLSALLTRVREKNPAGIKGQEEMIAVQFPGAIVPRHSYYGFGSWKIDATNSVSFHPALFFHPFHAAHMVLHRAIVIVPPSLSPSDALAFHILCDEVILPFSKGRR